MSVSFRPHGHTAEVGQNPQAMSAVKMQVEDFHLNKTNTGC